MSYSSPTALRPDALIHVAETGQKRLELIGRTATSACLFGGSEGDGAGFTSGPGPHELLCAALSACTAITIRLFAERHAWPATRIEVCTSYFTESGSGRGRFHREMAIDGPLSAVQREKLLSVGETCPVGKTLSQGAEVSITYRNALELAMTGQAVS